VSNLLYCTTKVYSSSTNAVFGRLSYADDCNRLHWTFTIVFSIQMVLSDRGTQFLSAEFGKYLSQFGIEKKSTTAFHPSSNGLCERFNKTIQERILVLLTETNSNRSEWLKYLPTALFNYRTAVHSTTKYRPVDLFFGFRVREFLPLNSVKLDSTIAKDAAKNIAYNRNNSTKRFSKNRYFPVGSQVMVKSPFSFKGKLKCNGNIATVIKQLDSHVYRARMEDGFESNVSSARLSPVSSGWNAVDEAEVIPPLRR